MAKTTKQAMKQSRQEHHRAKLSEGKHLQYAVESIEKIDKLKHSDTSAFELNKLKITTDLRLKLVDKIIPNLKAVAPMVEFEFNGEEKPHIQAAQVMVAISLGQIPPDIGGMFISSIKYMIDIEEYTDLKSRIESIEKSLNIPSD